MQQAFAIAAFVVVLILANTGFVNRAAVALFGASAVIAFGVIGQREAFEEVVDWNTIGLLVGMMVIVAILERTGVFEYLAIRSVRVSGDRPVPTLVLLGFAAAILSAFLGNVTAAFLMVPVTFLIADRLSVSTVPFLLTQVIASNIGGAATLVSSPSNLLIGTAADLSFMDFVLNLGPVVVPTLALVLAFLCLVFREDLRAAEGTGETLTGFDARGTIRDVPLLKRCLVVLSCVILGFFVHDFLGLQVATVALTGATVLMLVARSNVEEVLRGIQWSTLLFFVGLFVLVGSLEASGVVERVAGLLAELHGPQALAAVLSVWGSALGSGVAGNVSFTAAMVPIVQELATERGLSMAEAPPCGGRWP